MEDNEQITAYSYALLGNLYRFNEQVIQGGNENSALAVRPHKELADLAQDWSGKRRKLILMPRGSFKSSVVTVAYCIQQICANPNIRILIGSEVNATAKKFLREIKDNFEGNERLRYLYGDHVRKKSRWTDDEITSARRTSNLKDATVFTTGIDQSRTGSHCDLAILDDPVSNTNINTPEAREKTLQWYREISNNILDPDGHLIIIGTRWHYSDLYQYILDEEQDDFDVHIREALLTDHAYKILTAPDMSVEEKAASIPDEQLLFPTRLGVQELWSKYKSVGSAMFANQYLNRVMTDEDAVFKIENVRFFDPGSQNDRAKISRLNTYMTIDPAISLEDYADKTAIMVVGVDEENNWYVLDYENDKMKPQEIVERTFRMNEMYKPRKIGLEVVHFQKGLIYTFRDAERDRGQRLPLVEMKRDTRESKEVRIKSVLQPLVEQKRLSIQSGHLDLIEQLKTFPRSRYDDLLDTLADISQIMLGFRQGKAMKLPEQDSEKRWEANMKKQFPKRFTPSFSVNRTTFTNY